MKSLYVDDVLKKIEENKKVELLGWIKSKRDLGNTVFLDVTDSSGSIQVIIKKDVLTPEMFLEIKKAHVESVVKVSGIVVTNLSRNTKEISAKDFEVISPATLNVSPHPRKDFDIFNPKYTDLILSDRHLFLRNEKIMAILKFKCNFINIIHEWFKKQDFTHIDAPILTQALLYDDKSAFKIDFFGTELFLTQCVAFYLEAAINAFEKVYNLTPSFRAEHSRSTRHLAEFWHLKAEIAFANFNDMLKFSEKTFYYIIKNSIEKNKKELKTLNVSIDIDKLKPPYPKITYDKAIDILQSKGSKIEWGKSLGADEEKILSYEFEVPFFVTGLPSSVEPFPFAADPLNLKITKTADLITPDGYFEVLGIAEKIHKPDELLRRMKEVGKATKSLIERYKWYIELRNYGCAPHSGLGMGIERVIRWMLKLPHVRDVISFPRLYGRLPYP